jgi:hypothetical protein
MIRIRSMLAVIGAVSGLLAASPVLADPVGSTAAFTLNVDACSSGCGISPADYGTVTLTQESSTEIQVDVALAQTGCPSSPCVGFVSTGNGTNHPGFAFSLIGDPAVSITGITAGFVVGATNFTASGLGKFDYSLNCSACGSGASHPQPGPLIFDVTVSTGTISLASFVANSPNGNYFAADIGNPCIFTGDTKGCRKTGEVGGNSPPVIVECTGPNCAVLIPEPMTIALFGAGLAGIGGLARRRKAKKAA